MSSIGSAFRVANAAFDTVAPSLLEYVNTRNKRIENNRDWEFPGATRSHKGGYELATGKIHQFKSKIRENLNKQLINCPFTSIVNARLDRKGEQLSEESANSIMDQVFSDESARSRNLSDKKRFKIRSLKERNTGDTFANAAAKTMSYYDKAGRLIHHSLSHVFSALSKFEGKKWSIGFGDDYAGVMKV